MFTRQQAQHRQVKRIPKLQNRTESSSSLCRQKTSQPATVASQGAGGELPPQTGRSASLPARRTLAVCSLHPVDVVVVAVQRDGDEDDDVDWIRSPAGWLHASEDRPQLQGPDGPRGTEKIAVEKFLWENGADFFQI